MKRSDRAAGFGGLFLFCKGSFCGESPPARPPVSSCGPKRKTETKKDLFQGLLILGRVAQARPAPMILEAISSIVEFHF